MKSLIRHFKKVNGQSLAEFAVTTAMMATLATTAAPKFSGVGEGAKEKKTLADIDKILKSANNFYNEQVTKSGRGRFPGQWKYNEPVPSNGGYTYSSSQDEAEYAVKLAVQGIIGEDGSLTTQPTFTSFDNTADAPKWASCFGTNNPDALVPEISQGNAANISIVEDPSSAYYSNNEITVGVGAEEFLDGFGGEAIKSPFQDGHYIYTVIAGSGSGSQSIAPIMFVADLESPSSFWKKLQP
tara:strand:- start:3168 stop:3890 length:723 start_codon:yes stop_codon:yes gene_type:complete